MRLAFAGAIAAVACLTQLSPIGDEDRALAGIATSSGRKAIEGGILGCANRNRRARGLDRLRANRALNRAARFHARNMARQRFFEHTDPQGRGAGDRVALFDRAGRFDYIGENIAAGYRSPLEACRDWMTSSGHRRNILTPRYNRIGVGFSRGGPYGRYYVQVFARVQPSAPNRTAISWKEPAAPAHPTPKPPTRSPSARPG